MYPEQSCGDGVRMGRSEGFSELMVVLGGAGWCFSRKALYEAAGYFNSLVIFNVADFTHIVQNRASQHDKNPSGELRYNIISDFSLFPNYSF